MLYKWRLPVPIAIRARIVPMVERSFDETIRSLHVDAILRRKAREWSVSIKP